MKRLTALILSLAVLLGSGDEALAKGALKTLLGIYTTAKVAKGIVAVSREATQVRRRARLIREYMRDVEQVTGTKITKHQWTKAKDCLRNPAACLDPNSAKAWASDREGIIKGIERSTGKTWPTYKADVPSLKPGKKLVAAKGTQYDGHHLIPKAQGGPNLDWNIVAAPRPIHQFIIHGKP